MPDEHTIWVRLKPYNPSLGHVCMRRRISKNTFVHGQWIPLDKRKAGHAQLAEYLKTQVQHVGRPDSAKAFDICTPAEKAALILEESTATLRAAMSKPAPKLQPPPEVDISLDEPDVSPGPPAEIEDVATPVAEEEFEPAPEAVAAPLPPPPALPTVKAAKKAAAKRPVRRPVKKK